MRCDEVAGIEDIALGLIRILFHVLHFFSALVRFPFHTMCSVRAYEGVLP